MLRCITFAGAALSLSAVAPGVHAHLAGEVEPGMEHDEHDHEHEEEHDLEAKELWTLDEKNGFGKKEGEKGTHCPDRKLITPCTTEMKAYLIDKVRLKSETFGAEILTPDLRV